MLSPTPQIEAFQKQQTTRSEPLAVDELPPIKKQSLIDSTSPKNINCQQQTLVVLYSPHQIYCKSCKSMVNGIKHGVVGRKAWMWSLLCCVLSLGLFAWVPCVIERCKDNKTMCERCGRIIRVKQGDFF